VGLRRAGKRGGALTIAATAVLSVLAGSSLLAGLAAPAEAAVSGPGYGTEGWAGYAWPASSHQVSASLRLPSVSSSRNAGAAFWAGFGTGPGIEQTGFTANMVGGHLLWTAWYQLYPAPPVGFGQRAYSGDNVSMTVVNRGGGWFSLTVKDSTRHWTATAARHAGTVSASVAEVVVEAYGPPLARFSPATFTSVPASSGWVYRMPGTTVSALRNHSFSVNG
jgi:hypothetical protein